MGLYLAAGSLRDAIDRLSLSASQSKLADYLIFKRALKLSQNDAVARGNAESVIKVVTGLKSPPYARAVDEFALRTPPDTITDDTSNPYYIPFGSRRDKALGYRSPKFPSNGSSDTVARWQSQSPRPLTLVENSSPKAYTFTELSERDLREFFIVNQAPDNFSGEMARIEDTAVWWFRFTDLTARFGEAPTTRALIEAFVDDLHLSPVEEKALFLGLSETRANETLTFAQGIADPREYLPTAPNTRETRSDGRLGPSSVQGPAGSSRPHPAYLLSYLQRRGFVFEPWQIAAFVTAVRTKPFVLLAGISGTGKTKLPRLVAEATGAECSLVPVRPDWTDSSELLGYERIDGSFQPGSMVRFARKAQENPHRQFFFVLDEMNIARVEYYMAEVLSQMEERREQPDGSVSSDPLLAYLGDARSAGPWSDVRLTGNLCIVGSVNMDETTHGFSRKVLDRAFVIEFSSVDLTAVGEPSSEEVANETWQASDWAVRSTMLAHHPQRGVRAVEEIIGTLVTVNEALALGQLQFGYRVRDEITMFCLEAQECLDLFTTSDQGTVDPLDLAVAMKVLPRIQGGGATTGRVLDALYSWAAPTARQGESAPGFPFCAERLSLMRTRLKDLGFASYWL